MASNVEIDIPCDVQQVDGTGFVWTFLDEARDPTRITVGAIVVTGDEVDPVLARSCRSRSGRAVSRSTSSCFLATRGSTPTPWPGHTCCRPEAMAGAIVTLPADAQQIDQTGHVWAFLEDSPRPDRVPPGRPECPARRANTHRRTRRAVGSRLQAPIGSCQPHPAR